MSSRTTTYVGLAGASTEAVLVLSFLCWCCLYGASLYSSVVRQGAELYTTINIKISSNTASFTALTVATLTKTPHLSCFISAG